MTDTRISQDTVHDNLHNLQHIIPFVDALESSIHTAKLGTLLASTPYLLTKDGDKIEKADKPELYTAKQDELYFHILNRIKVTSVLSELKEDTIKKHGTGAGTMAYRHVLTLKARGETEIVESIRGKLRKLPRSMSGWSIRPRAASHAALRTHAST